MLGPNIRRRVGRALHVLLLVACVWLVAPESAWAKKQPQAAEPATKNYALPYGLVILGVVLGVVVVVRPSHRLNEPKQPVVGKDG